jgi:glycosyltransferase involved in cell wall biosynthesis
VKIVHIGEFGSGGGAAHAMSRLHLSLRRLGIDSRLLVRSGTSAGDADETIATRGDADRFFPVVREAVARQYVELNRTAVTNTHFSLHIDGADVSRVPLVASSDILHLHWTASFQTPSDVRALFDVKPAVWTLHDLEPLTGGCHFPVGCEGYVHDCGACPQLEHDPFAVTATTLRDKTALWSGARPTFIAPSRFMADCARRSAVVRATGASIIHIPHGIDLEVFRPQSKAAARRALGVPVDGLYVLCGSTHNEETRKGLRLLNRVLAVATTRARADAPELKLLTVGEPEVDVHDFDVNAVFKLGSVPVDRMPLVYVAADVFLHPSLEDNFPCMLLESLACGTPAIAFDVGGVADIVEDELCGRLVAGGDELAMGRALADLVGDPELLRRMSERARAHVAEHFSDDLIARKHAELYDGIVNDGAALRAPAQRPKSELDEIFPRWAAACLTQELALAEERAAQLAADAQAKSEHIAALSLQVQEKEAELLAIHDVAEERKALADRLHALAASAEASAASSEAHVRERDELLAELEAKNTEQAAEIELVHRVAADRRVLIEDLHRVAEQRAALIDRLVAEEQRVADPAS